ncbi:beta-hexosaminidase [Candidatus Saccharibacteria bacterium]|nr:beta-hexosaminidase [Candidatus Saccharibacteria bacterium]
MSKLTKILIVVTVALFAGYAALIIATKNFDSATVAVSIEKGVSNELYGAYYERAAEILDGMTLDEKVGQLLFARAPEMNIKSVATNYHLGGLILFGRDVDGQSLASIKTKVDSWQRDLNTKLFIGIDEEGGLVSRLSYAGLADFASPQELYAQGGMDAILTDTATKISTLDSIGVNVNFAPVADVCEDKNSFIYARTFGQGASATADYIKNVTEKYHGSNISATLKHFPGYGCNVDTHRLVSVDTRSIASFKENDFLPFEAGIKAGADFVMVSHNIIQEIDASAPASLSHDVHKILADDLGFSGVIITDDLSMDAIAEYYHGEYPAEVQAVLAGNNMLIVTDYATAFNNIKSAVENGIIKESYLDYQLMPVLGLKVKKGLTTLR